MKKRIVPFLLAMALFSAVIISAVAAETRAADYVPSLSFSGTTANCYVSITALGKPITATLELWHGSTCVDSWTGSATSRLIISQKCSVADGETYTLKVSGTIDGVSFTGTPVSGTCP